MPDGLTPILRSLLAAVDNAPGDAPLRLHVAQTLLDAGRPAEALEQCAAAVKLNPDDPAASRLLAAIGSTLSSAADFDWDGAEAQMGPDEAGPPAPAPVEEPAVERPELRLSDVGGMEEVKAELRASFLVPMANPGLRAAYRTSLTGGLLLYGPPGCGKTFLARALAGEIGAGFEAVSLADVLEMWVGQSERNVQSLFALARRCRPSVIFLDEVDAIGHKRANLRASPAMRGTVNQLLSEMDGAGGANEGVYVLAATNQPWDVDTALRRPGRFDRTLFVGPPDVDARQAILRFHLKDRPVGAVDYERLARGTDGYSGADLAQVCNVATRAALADSARTGTVRPIEMGDLDQARRRVRPSTAEWLSTAKQAATFANHDGSYDELTAYLKAKRLW